MRLQQAQEEQQKPGGRGGGGQQLLQKLPSRWLFIYTRPGLARSAAHSRAAGRTPAGDCRHKSEGEAAQRRRRRRATRGEDHAWEGALNAPPGKKTAYGAQRISQNTDVLTGKTTRHVHLRSSSAARAMQGRTKSIKETTRCVGASPSRAVGARSDGADCFSYTARAYVLSLCEGARRKAPARRVLAAGPPLAAQLLPPLRTRTRPPLVGGRSEEHRRPTRTILRRLVARLRVRSPSRCAQ